MSERLPQRLLAVVLRTEIDRALAGDTRAARKALAIARSHPAGVRSSHVRHNLKPWRLDWLARAQARACQVDPSRSFGSLEE
jgi:FAD/FMN-containing dehydrogenase